MSTWPTIHGTRAFVLTDLALNAWTLRTATPERTESGPDVLKLVYEGRFNPAAGTWPTITAYDRGAVPPSYAGAGTWRVVSATPARLSGPIWRLDVTAKGQIATQEPKIRWINGASSFTAEDVAVSGYSGTQPKVEGRMPGVGMEIGYLTFAATPSPPASGVAATPDNPRPATPANPWSSLPADKVVLHYPSGWVREAVDNDRIVPGLWWTTERYSYVFEITG
jgi:hypothetical protein